MWGMFQINERNVRAVPKKEEKGPDCLSYKQAFNKAELPSTPGSPQSTSAHHSQLVKLFSTQAKTDASHHRSS